MQPGVYVSPRLVLVSSQFVEELQSGSRSPENKEPVPFCGLVVSVSLPLLSGRSGGAFVTGEPLIKFPLHP